jgi:hypothetical protein
MIFPADDAGGFDGRTADLQQVRAAGIVGVRFGQDQFDESEDDGEVVAQGVQGDTVERDGRGRFVHLEIMRGNGLPGCRNRAGSV